MPPFTSYAYNAEDVVLRRVFAGQTAGFYIEIGAADPARHSATKALYDAGWRGLNVAFGDEDQAALAAARPHDATLLVSRGDSPPLARLLAEHAPDKTIDLLIMDAASAAAILASPDIGQIRPRVILAGAVSGSGAATHEAWEPALLGAGYRFGLFDGLNRFYCREEDAALLPRLGRPACALDDWRPAREAAAAARVASLAASRTALQSQHSDYVRATLAQQRAAEAALAEERAARAAAERETHLVHLRLRDMEAALQAQQQANTQVQLSLPVLQRQLAEQRAALARLTASRSWKITAPLRDVVRLAVLFRPGG